jgi:hypothetical protein
MGHCDLFHLCLAQGFTGSRFECAKHLKIKLNSGLIKRQPSGSPGKSWNEHERITNVRSHQDRR